MSTCPTCGSFVPWTAQFFLEIRQDSCEKIACQRPKIPHCWTHRQFSNNPQPIPMAYQECRPLCRLARGGGCLIGKSGRRVPLFRGDSREIFLLLRRKIWYTGAQQNRKAARDMRERRDHRREAAAEADGIIEGRNAVLEALRAGTPIDKLYLAR